MKRGGAVRRWALAAALGALAATTPGCTTGTARNYRHVSFRPNEHFRVQFLLPEGMVERPVEIESLLLLPPVGFADREQSEALMMATWQEMQQGLPGIVRAPRKDGPYKNYVGGDNLLMDDGRLNGEELERIGRMAGTSHLLAARVINYRPYYPQSLIMEWVLLDVGRKQAVLVLAGSLDSAEQKVVTAAENYVKNRRAESKQGGDVDVLLRSPREYFRFASALAADALKGWVRPKSEVYVPYLSY